MEPTIAIQDVLVPHREVVRDLEACSRADIKPITFGLIPFSDEITGDFDRTVPAIPFGSTKLIKLWMQGKTPKGWCVFYNEENFDQRYWAPLIGDLALNPYFEMARLGNVKEHTWPTAMFVKPTNDLKAFAGMVVEVGESIAERLAALTTDINLTDEQSIIVTPAVEIECEFRCFMQGPYLIEASRYKTGTRATHVVVTEDECEGLKTFTTRLAARFMPAKFYVVDVALMPNGSMRVVEYNCVNCSGRYEIDRAALFKRMLA